MITFRALTTTVSVSVADNVHYRDLVEHLVASYERTESGELDYELSTTELRRDGETLPFNGPGDLVRRFEVDLYEQVIKRAASGWVLHAAAIDVGGRALVLCGPSGAGKTTLTLALASRGLRILTEEGVWIDRSGTVRGLARPFHVSDDEEDLRIPSAWTRYSYPARGPDGDVPRPMAVPPPGTYRHGDLPLLAIVRLGHGPDWPVYLRESPPTTALQRLWDRSLRHDDSGLATAISLLRTHPSYELSSTALSEALALIDPLLK